MKLEFYRLNYFTVGAGEGLNFAAYSLIPASVVTPLGALSVIVTALLSSYILNESLNILGKIGCLLCVIGSTIIVIHSPPEGVIDDLESLGYMIGSPEFLLYMALVLTITIGLIMIAAPRYGSSHILVYILICSMIGSLSVCACKGLGLGLRQVFLGIHDDLTTGLFWFLVFAVILSITVQMNYLNKALDIFETSLVTPIYYVLFTTFVLIASSILFKEYSRITYTDITGNLCGFVTTVIGIFLLNSFKDFELSFEDLKSHWRNSQFRSSSSRLKTSFATERLDEEDSTQKLLNSVKEVTFASRKKGKEKRKYQHKRPLVHGHDIYAANVKINVEDSSDSSTTN